MILDASEAAELLQMLLACYDDLPGRMIAQHAAVMVLAVAFAISTWPGNSTLPPHPLLPSF